MPEKRKEGIIIAGCGRFGSFLASQLDMTDEKIVVIDINAEALATLTSDFNGSTVNGDASNIETLHQAGISRAKAVIASTQDDNVNLMIAEIARDIYEVPSVIAMVNDAERLAMKDDYGFSMLCPAIIMSQAVFRELNAKEGLL